MVVDRRMYALPLAMSRMRMVVAILMSASSAVLSSGCESAGGTAAAVVGGTLLGAQSPGQELQQVYYLGVYDPLEQVPPAFYRITVHGQASVISLMRFGSGWVPAELSDSLNTNISFSGREEDGLTSSTSSDSKVTGGISPMRRMVLYGPEGFREAPANHRLVIVMGSSPESYFRAIDQVLGTINPRNKSTGELKQQLFDELMKTRAERESLAWSTETLAQ